MIPILYQDSHIVVCVKPSGVVSQDAGENSMPQLLKQQLGAEYVAVVHRLDREVGGVMVFALSQKAAAVLTRSVQERTLEKRYLAVLCGTPTVEEAVLEDLLFHDKQRNKTYVVSRERKGVKPARLSYRLLQTISGSSLVDVHLDTGRTHQIRVQFSSRGLPLSGDRKYGGTSGPMGLWSCRLVFPHPITGKIMKFTEQPPRTDPWQMFDLEQMNDVLR
jgi:23S rRNA pseudouridine1911/1915/1917 synthase